MDCFVLTNPMPYDTCPFLISMLFLHLDILLHFILIPSSHDVSCLCFFNDSFILQPTIAPICSQIVPTIVVAFVSYSFPYLSFLGLVLVGFGPVIASLRSPIRYRLAISCSR